ncbi:outer membrane protein assembly factor BamB family protein [Cellulomonas sp. URHB0016]
MEMHDVDLVETGAPDAGSPAARTDAGRPSWRRIAAAAVAVLVALLMVQAAVGARAQHAEEGPRAVHPVPAPERSLSVRWRIAGAGAAAGPVRVGSTLVGVTPGDDGRAQVVGLDPATGAPLWQVPVDAPFDADGAGCAELDGPDGTPTRAACVAGNHDSGSARVVVVDLPSGAPVGTWPVLGAPWTTVDDLVVLAHGDSDGSAVGWTLTAYGATGATEWVTTTPRVPLPDGSDGSLARPADLIGGDGWVALTDHGHGWVVRADGTVLADRELGQGWVDVTRHGVPALVTDGDTDGSRDTVLLDRAEVPLHGLPVATEPDDGSAPSVDLYALDLSGRGLVARDTRTGADLWTDRDVTVGAAAVRDGALYTVGGDEVRAYDAADGTLRWHVRFAAATAVTVDDDQVLATSGPNLTVVALDRRTGRALWRSDVGDLARAGGSAGPPFLAPWHGLLRLDVGESSWVIG